jgi:hypothetical protein
MQRKHASLLMGVVGVVFFLLVLVVGGGAWFFASAFDRRDAGAAMATASFEDVRRRYVGTAPVFGIAAGETVVVRREPPASPPAPVQRLHLRHWSPDEGGLVDVTLPFWLVRLNPGEFSMTADRHGLREVTAAQIERYGPTLLVDHESARGGRLLIWTE